MPDDNKKKRPKEYEVNKITSTKKGNRVIPVGLTKYFQAALKKLDSLEFGDPSDYLRSVHNIEVPKTLLSAIWVAPVFKKFDGKQEDVAFIDFINESAPQLVLADPGCGKSTLSRFLTCDYIKKYISSEQDYFGIFVPLSIFNKPEGSTGDDIAFCAAEFVGLEKDKEVLDELSKNILNACIIFDGFDELPSSPSNRTKENSFAIRSEVVTFINNVESNAYINSNGESQQRYIVLCRKVDYKGYDEKSKLRIQTRVMTEFSSDQMKEAVVNWHNAAIEKIRVLDTNHSEVPNISTRQTEILSVLREHSDLAKICQTPFMLNAFQTVNQNAKDLPTSVSKLCWRAIYWFFVDKHFEHEIASLVKDFKECILSAIVEIGSQIHDREVNSKTTRFTKHELRAITEKSFKLNGLDKKLDESEFENSITKVHIFLMRGHGILVNRSSNDDVEFDFVHSVFREVAAGRWLLSKKIAELSDYALNTGWHNPIRYWAGFKSTETEDGLYMISSFVSQLSQPKYKEDIAAIAACGEMLVEVICCKKQEEITQDLKDHIKNTSNKLCELLKQNNLSLVQRIRIGDLLAILGDPRFLIAIEKRTTPIPTGTYNIGRSEIHKTSISKKYEDCSATPITTGVLKDYSLGNYLVTNEEFNEFIKANGYKTKKYWTDSIGWNWAQGDETTLEYLVTEAKKVGRLHLTSEIAGNMVLASQIDERCVQTIRRNLPMYWSDPAFNRPNQPIVGINWWEATAYCNWLEEMLKKEESIPTSKIVRLPTEAEWETAARLCGDGNSYAWVDGEPFNCALVKSSFNREGESSFLSAHIRSCGVGLFDFLQTKLPIFDLVGNVWEWTASKVHKYSGDSFKQEIEVTGMDDRIARGSSWLSSEEESSQITFRSYDPPYNAYSDLGFRIVIF